MKISRFRSWIFIIVILVISSLFFFGCNDNQNNNTGKREDAINFANIEKYHATLYIPTSDWFNKDFLDNNWTAGMVIMIGYDEYGFPIGDSVPNDGYPKSRTFIIRTQNEFEEMFKEFPVQIDFESQMLLLYMETSIFPISDILTDIEIYNETIFIYATYEHPISASGQPIPNTSAPTQKYTVIILDKCTQNSFEIKGSKKSIYIYVD